MEHQNSAVMRKKMFKVSYIHLLAFCRVIQIWSYLKSIAILKTEQKQGDASLLRYSTSKSFRCADISIYCSF